MYCSVGCRIKVLHELISSTLRNYLVISGGGISVYFSVVSSVRVYWLMLSFNPVQVLIAAALCYSLILPNCDFFYFFFINPSL